MQRVNRKMTKTQMLSVPFKHRAELFEKAVEQAAKRFMVGLACGYINACDDYHIIIEDNIDKHNEVYYHTLTQEES